MADGCRQAVARVAARGPEEGVQPGREAHPASTAPPRPLRGADVLIPPLNFSIVSKGVYRAGYPNEKNISFLRKLKLRTVLYLGTDSGYHAGIEAFLVAERIRLVRCPMEGNQEPFVSISSKAMRRALRVVQDPANRPILFHCLKGTHRTSCLVGCLRRAEGWSLMSVFDEYRRFTGTKGRILDLQFIEQFPLARPADEAEG